MSLDDASSDVIYLSSLALSANIGPDRWGRPRTQPLSLSVAIHLRDAALSPSPRPSYSSVTDSSGGLDVSACAGALAEDIIAMCEKPSTKWDSAAVLAMGVALLAAHRTEGRARELRVTVSAPEAVPLAKEYAVEFIGYAQALGSQQTKSTGSRVKVRVRDLVIPAVIGTTQTEREAKQLVAADITIFERPSQVHFADYPMVFNKLSQVCHMPFDLVNVRAAKAHRVTL